MSTWKTSKRTKISTWDKKKILLLKRKMSTWKNSRHEIKTSTWNENLENRSNSRTGITNQSEFERKANKRRENWSEESRHWFSCCTLLVEKFARVVWTSSITKTNGNRVITFDTQVKTALSFWKPWPSLWERPFLQSRALWPGIWKVERLDLNLLWYKRYTLFCYGINCGDTLHKRFETRTISSSCLVRSMVTSLPKGTVVK